MTSFAITLYGQCCRCHVVGQPVISDIRVVCIVVEVFVACVLNVIIRLLIAFLIETYIFLHIYETYLTYNMAACTW